MCLYLWNIRNNDSYHIQAYSYIREMKKVTNYEGNVVKRKPIKMNYLLTCSKGMHQDLFRTGFRLDSVEGHFLQLCGVSTLIQLRRFLSHHLMRALSWWGRWLAHMFPTCWAGPEL